MTFWGVHMLLAASVFIHRQQACVLWCFENNLCLNEQQCSLEWFWFMYRSVCELISTLLHCKIHTEQITVSLCVDRLETAGLIESLIWPTKTLTGCMTIWWKCEFSEGRFYVFVLFKIWILCFLVNLRCRESVGRAKNFSCPAVLIVKMFSSRLPSRSQLSYLLRLSLVK